MFRNQCIFFFSIFIIILSIQGCSPSYKLTSGESISRKEILREVEAFIADPESSNYYSSEKLRIRKRSEEKAEKENSLYETINNLPVGKMSEAIPFGKKSIFYVKTDSTSKTYYQPDQINVFQPRSINDALFHEEVDRIIALLEKGEITMDQIKETLNEDYDINVQYFKNTIFVEEEKFKPEVIELLKSSKVNSVYKTEKVQVGPATYLSLIQNIGIKKVNPVCQYFSITLK